MDVTRAERRIVAIAALLLVGIQVLLFHSLRHDDAFISLRYSQNLVLGRGLVFNSGEYLMGSTSPGHVLLGALVYALFGLARTPSVMSAIGCFGWTAQALGVAYLLRRTIGLKAYAVALVVACGGAWSYRFLALETNLVAALVIWTFAVANRERWVLAGALAGLAILTRADAVLALFPLGLVALGRLRAQAWRPATAAAIAPLGWAIFARLYYGTIVPQSAVVKIGSMEVADYARLTANYLGDCMLNAAMKWPNVSAVSSLTFAVLAVIGASSVVLIHRDRKLWVLPAAWLAHGLTYALLLRSSIAGLEWHMYPAMLFEVIIVCTAGAFVVERAAARKRWVGAVSMVVLGLLLVFLSVRTARFGAVHQTAFWYGARQGVYEQVAAYINERSRKDDLLITREPGTLAYYTDLRVIDLERLVTPEPSRELAKGRGHRSFTVELWSHPDGAALFQSPPVTPIDLVMKERFEASVQIGAASDSPGQGP